MKFASYDELAIQAPKTVVGFYDDILRKLDKIHGSRHHPASLVETLVRCATDEFISAARMKFEQEEK